MYRVLEMCRAAVSLIAPNRCPFCDGIVGMTEYWCDSCYGKLAFLEEQSELPEGLDGLVSVCRYTGRARSAILRMKQGGYIYSIDAFAVMMAEAGGELISDADIITAVPGSFSRRMQLGYAHAEKIARNIAYRGRKQYRTLLSQSVKLQEQKQLDRKQRIENVRNAYKIVDKEYISGKNILVVDDVCTTGATLSVIAAKLKEAGAVKVYGLTFAKTLSV